MKAYYNDNDKNTCLWLEQLIKNGDITKGDVDDRSITEIKPEDIAGYDRVHLFAGIGTWDYALNQAGWGDKPVLTASLPCQPFSAAGKGLGKADERHLLPQAINLIIQSGIDTIFGEQVEKAIKFGWLDDLQTIMEAEGYAIGHCVLGAHSASKEPKTGIENKLFSFIGRRFGAIEADLFRDWWFERGFGDGFGAEPPHIRQRLYWVANAVNDSSKRTVSRINGQEGGGEVSNGKDIAITGQSSGAGNNVLRLGNPERERLEGFAWDENSVCEQGRDNTKPDGSIAEAGGNSRMANAKNSGNRGRLRELYITNAKQQARQEQRKNKSEQLVNGISDNYIEWLWCRDNKYRPIKSSVKPLVDGPAGGMVHSSDPSAQIEANGTQEARTMRLKGYGNAIQAQTAEMFIRAVMEC